MRQSVVNRSVLVLSGALLLACAGFAWVVERPSADPPAAAAMPPETTTVVEGSRLYEARCERCHSLEEALSPLRAAGNSVDGRAAYIAFLQRHRKSAADEHESITDYLLSEQPQREDR